MLMQINNCAAFYTEAGDGHHKMRNNLNEVEVKVETCAREANVYTQGRSKRTAIIDCS